MKIFVFELIWHIDYQIKMLNLASKLTTDKKKKNVYSKELNRFVKLKKQLSRLRESVKFTASVDNVKEYLMSDEFIKQLERVSGYAS